ncbi:MAG: TlyA family RNA methyltransferase [Oligoflexia bacterium]|nr:TlyA family RNA methyltransferase [Oligoflexia bacterium]
MKKRIDLLLVERGLVASREKAQALILAGQVLVNDVPAQKAGQAVAEEAVIRVRGEDHPYVSRGGLKLAAALDAFNISAQDRLALDVGASTGGFTHVLLLRGIRKVHAVDVGHNQLDWKIRRDPRVVVYEKVNARHARFDLIGEKVDLIVVDVSFISLDKILPALTQFSHSETDWVTLIKPQFEVGKDKIGKGGIVQSEEARQEAVARLTRVAETIGLARLGLIESPITGTEGNKEYLAHWKQS